MADYEAYNAGKGHVSYTNRLIDAAGVGFSFGVAWQSCMSLMMGMRQQPKGSKNRVIKGLRAAWEINSINVPRLRGFPGYFILFEVIESGLFYFRKKDDDMGFVVAGAITGWFWGIRRGFRHAARIGIQDGLFFGACGIAYFAYDRRFRSYLTKQEKEKEKNRKMIKALAEFNKQPMPTRNWLNSDTAQGFGGLYGCLGPKVRPYLSSGSKMEDKGI